MQIIHDNLYDHPKYYDLVFGCDWRAELYFLLDCWRKHTSRRVRRLFEPACGSGRLLFRLARAGFEVSGLDLSEPAVRYCNDRLDRYGFPRSAFVGDMSRFRLPHKVDAAFNMINSFRHLTSGRATKRHFRCMADALHDGGLYVVGLHLTPTLGEPSDEESWSTRRGHLSVRIRMWTIERNMGRRREHVRIAVDVRTKSRRFRLADDMRFRTYTAEQLKRLLRDVPEFQSVGFYDFGYDVDAPIDLEPETEDVVVVLRKRKPHRSKHT